MVGLKGLQILRLRVFEPGAYHAGYPYYNNQFWWQGEHEDAKLALVPKSNAFAILWLALCS